MSPSFRRCRSSSAITRVFSAVSAAVDELVYRSLVRRHARSDTAKRDRTQHWSRTSRDVPAIAVFHLCRGLTGATLRPLPACRLPLSVAASSRACIGQSPLRTSLFPRHCDGSRAMRRDAPGSPSLCLTVGCDLLVCGFVVGVASADLLIGLFRDQPLLFLCDLVADRSDQLFTQTNVDSSHPVNWSQMSWMVDTKSFQNEASDDVHDTHPV